MKTKTYLMLGSMLALPMAVPATAQSTPATNERGGADLADQVEADPDNVIIVTGSYIRGQREDGALPVDVFGQEELETRGIDSPLEFIKSLPSVGPVLGDSNQYSAGTSQGVGSINLRSLGRERTLVLFNGRRFIPQPGDGAADTNLIPLFALERIEVLKDGAASTYGSDAIAGVANFVTRRNFDGFEASGDYQFVNGSDDNYRLSVLAGFDIGTANLMLGAGWQHRSELPTTERDFTQIPYADNPTGFSFLSNPGTYLPQAVFAPGAPPTTLGLGIDGSLVNACTSLGGLNGVFPTGTSVLPVCRYSYVPFVNLVEDEDRYQVFGQFTADLSDRVSVTIDALWSRTELLELGYSPSYPPTQGPNGPGSANAFRVPRSNPGFNTFLRQTFPATSLANLATSASILFFRPFALGGNPLDERGAGLGQAVTDSWRVAGGLDIGLTDNLDFSIFGTYIRAERRAFSQDFVSDRLQRALNGLGGPNCAGTTPGANGCQYFNPFINSSPGNPALGLDNPAYVPGLENDPTLIDWLYQPSGTRAREDQYIADAVFSGTATLGGLDVGYAFGGQYRKSDFASDPLNRFASSAAYPCPIEGVTSCRFPVGAFIFLGQFPSVRLDQDIYAVFAEAQIEPFTGFEITGAIRYEDYGGMVGSTVNPKVSARWQLSDNFSLRGSIGDTFRGPLAADVSTAGISGVAGIDAIGGNFKAIDTTGNPALLPETALTYNVGALVEFGGFSASVDYWTYEFEGRFSLLPIQAIAAAAAPGGTAGTQFVDCGSPFSQFLTFAGGTCTQGVTIANDISRIRTQTVNGPDVNTSGLDFNVNYRGDFGAVAFNVGANATHVLEYEFGDFEFEGLTFSQGYEASGFANYDRDPGTVSKWRASGYANFQVEPFSVTYSATYVEGVDDNRCPDSAPCTSTPEFGPTDFGRRVGSYLQHDLLASVDVDLGGLEVTIQGGVENFTDEDPPAARLEYSYDPFIGNALGRTYKIGTKVRF